MRSWEELTNVSWARREDRRRTDGRETDDLGRGVDGARIMAREQMGRTAMGND